VGQNAAPLSDNPQIVMMQNMFSKKHVEYEQPVTVIPPKGLSHAETVRYSSDESSSDSESESDDDISDGPSRLTSQHQATAPARKQQQQEVPYRIERLEKRKKSRVEFEDALRDLQKLPKSKKTCFVAGPNSLQACRTAAMETHLRLVIANR